MKNKGAMQENPAQTWKSARRWGDASHLIFIKHVEASFVAGSLLKVSVIWWITTCAHEVAPLIAVLPRQHVCPLKLAACAR